MDNRKNKSMGTSLIYGNSTILIGAVVEKAEF